MSTVLVTGVDQGFGALVSLGFAREGHRVFAGMTDTGKGTALRDAAATESLDLTVVALDATDPASPPAAVDEVVSATGSIDILVNCALSELRGPIEEVDDDEMLAQFETNVFGLVRVLRAVSPVMRAQRSGVIVNVSSIAGLVARPFGALYSASKHAIEAISEALHSELASYGVRVAIIEPGQFATASDSVVVARRFGEDSPYAASSARFDAAIRTLAPDGEPAAPQVVADTIIAVAQDPGAPLRHLVGVDAELIMSVRRAGDFESYERTMRAALNWWD
jgi:NAD(P)-dependent dehydrogenase (short-subunit alcohol dehydrogenase family)